MHAQRDAHVEHHGAHRLQRHVGRQDGAGGLAGGNAPRGEADGHFLVDLLVAADDGARRGQSQAAAVVDAVERAAYVDIRLARCAVEQAGRAGLQAARGQRDVAADLVGELQLVVKAGDIAAAGTRQLLLAGADLRHVGLDATLGLIQEGLRGLAADATGHLVAGLGQGRERQQRRHREGEDRSSGKLCPAGGEGRQTTRVCDRGPHDCCTQIDVATMFQGADGAPRIALREGGNPLGMILLENIVRSISGRTSGHELAPDRPGISLSVFCLSFVSTESLVYRNGNMSGCSPRSPRHSG